MTAQRPLTTTEELLLQDCEAAIRRGLSAFIETGEALLKVRDGQLWRGRYDSFQDYLHRRWNLKRGRAYELLSAAEVVRDLRTAGVQELPQCEGQARPLRPVPAEQRATVWEAARREAQDGKPTRTQVDRVARRLIGGQQEPVKPCGVIDDRTVRFTPDAWDSLTAVAGEGREYAFLLELLAGVQPLLQAA